MTDTPAVNHSADKISPIDSHSSKVPDWISNAASSAYDGAKTALTNPYVDGALALGVAAVVSRRAIASIGKSLLSGSEDVIAGSIEGSALAPKAAVAAVGERPGFALNSLGGPSPKGLDLDAVLARYGVSKSPISFKMVDLGGEQPLRTIYSPIEGGVDFNRSSLAASIADMSTADGENTLTTGAFLPLPRNARLAPLRLEDIIPKEIAWGPRL